MIRVDQYNVESLIDTIVEFSQTARVKRSAGAGGKANALEDEFLKRHPLCCGRHGSRKSTAMEEELDNMITRHDAEIAIYERAASYALSFGMIGTPGRLDQYVKNLNLSEGGSDAIGVNMSTALVTTLYGCMLANLIFNPIATKLHIRSDEETFYKQMIIEGVLGIQAGDNPKDAAKSWLP